MVDLVAGICIGIGVAIVAVGIYLFKPDKTDSQTSIIKINGHPVVKRSRFRKL